MAVHSKLSRVRFCHGKPKSIRRKESENIPNIINRTLSHVEIENFSSSLQYYRNYISKMGERKNSLQIRLPPRRSQIKKSTLKNTNKTVLQNGMGEIRSPNYMLRRPEATMESWSFCLSLGVPQLFVVSLLLTLSCVYPGYSLLSSAYKISG